MRVTTKSRQLPLKQRAYDAILERILGGQFTPGELLNRRGVAQQLGMSSAPVHEAMIQLERDGFLEALPRLGTRVRAAGREDVRGHLIVREALECQAARLICGERMRQAMPQLKPLAAAADSVAQSDTDRARQEVAFHVALVELADCPALLREYRRVMQIGLFYRINLVMNMPLREPADRHSALLKELCDATPEAADAACRRHVWSGKPDSLKGAQPVSGRKKRGENNT